MLTSKERLEILERISEKEKENIQYKVTISERCSGKTLMNETNTVEVTMHALRTCLGISKHDCTDCPYYKEKKLKNGDMYHCIYHLYNVIRSKVYGSK